MQRIYQDLDMMAYEDPTQISLDQLLKDIIELTDGNTYKLMNLRNYMEAIKAAYRKD